MYPTLRSVGGYESTSAPTPALTCTHQNIYDHTLHLHPYIPLGTVLCRLVSCIQKRSVGGYVSRPTNAMQSLNNLTVALAAITQDKVRLVNIGSILDHML